MTTTSRPTRRLALGTLSIAAISGIGLTAVPAYADATPVTVTDAAGFATALTAATDGGTIRLGGNVTVTDPSIIVPASVTLDLAGHALTTGNITVSDSETLTVSDSAGGGTLKATAHDVPYDSEEPALAGITTTDAAVVITGGTVTAHGATRADDGFDGAGIGGNGREGVGDLPWDAEQVPSNGGSITVTGGTVNAVGGDNAAGLGGGAYGSGGTVTVSGGTVTATSSDGTLSTGAGIGGGYGGSGGTLIVTGGTVSAAGSIGIGSGDGGAYDDNPEIAGTAGSISVTGGSVVATGSGGPGIGGAGNGYLYGDGGGGTLSFTGGTTVATGSKGAAAIGGAGRTRGADVTIGAGATVTAIVGADDTSGILASAVGQGGGTYRTRTSATPLRMPFGTLTVAGTLILPTGSALRAPSDASVTLEQTGVIGGAGRIEALAAVSPLAASVGTIVNHGTIKAETTVSGVTVTDHHYALTFDPNQGTFAAGTATTAPLYASTLDAAGLTAPVATRPGFTAIGWNTAADGTGTAVTATSTISADTTLYAAWGVAPTITRQPAATTVKAGATATFTAAATGTPEPSVQWQSKPSTPASAEWRDVAGATSTTLAVTKAAAGQSGTAYRAVFTNAAGTVTSTVATLSVTTPAIVLHATPGAPRSLKAKAGTKRLTVTWKAPSSTGGTALTGYRVLYSADGGKHWKTRTVRPSTTRVVLTKLKKRHRYVVRVSAVSRVGVGSAATTRAKTK
jgi:hypothetical protein